MTCYIGDILEELCVNTFSDVCGYVISGHRPSATEKKKEFVVISTSNSCYDHGVFQRASVYVSIFVKNLQGGLENTRRLNELTNNVLQKFPIRHKNKDGVVDWAVTRPQLVLRGDDELGFSEWTIRGLLNINTTDNFQINKV